MTGILMEGCEIKILWEEWFGHFDRFHMFHVGYF